MRSGVGIANRVYSHQKVCELLFVPVLQATEKVQYPLRCHQFDFGPTQSDYQLDSNLLGSSFEKTD